MSLLEEKFNRIKSNPPLVLVLGFALLITIGGLLLSLETMTRSGQPTAIIDSFFVAGSASCVTGLTPVNTFEYWNFKGQLVVIILIQIGGLGIMTFATILPILLRRKIGLSGSTAGGLKTTSFGVLIVSTISTIRENEQPVLFNKHIGQNTIQKALALVVICMTIVIMVTFVITIIEEFEFIDILYEVVSAFATVGASTGITPIYLS